MARDLFEGSPPAGPRDLFAETKTRPLNEGEKRANGQVRSQNDRKIQDAQQDDGFLDRMGSLVDQGFSWMQSGANRTASALQEWSANNPLPWTSSENIARERATAEVRREQARAQERFQNTKVAGSTSWEDIKANPSLGGIGSFVLETGVQSLPQMAAAGLAVPTLIGSQAGNIAQSRAQANGREDATARDVAIATPFAVGSSLLEGAGIGGILGAAGTTALSRVAKAGATEAGTEFLQSGLESLGGTAGTDQGVDWASTLDQSVAGAVGGAGMGAGLRGGGEIVTGIGKRAVARGRRESALDDVTLTPEDVASPLPNEAIAQGKADIARGDALGAADSILTQAGMPNVGRRVTIDGYGPGVVEDAFSEGEARGVVVKLDDGRTFREHFDDLADAGVGIREENDLGRFAAEAEAIDASLREAAQQSSVATPVAAPATAATGPATEQATRALTPGEGARAGTDGFDIDRYMARNQSVESSGNDSAKAATSSATGRYQFTDATWRQYYRKTFGNTGETDSQIMAKRLNGDVQNSVMRVFTQDGVNTVKRTGASVTDGNVYLAHFLGGGSASKVLRADPSTPVEQLLTSQQIAANKSILGGGKTAGDVIAWAAKKMGGAVPQLPTQSGTVESAGIEFDNTPMADAPAIDFADAAAPAPVDAGTERAPIDIRTEDRSDKVTTANNRDVQVKYGVVEAKSLRASNLPDGRVNPAYPAEMQPRDRTRAASQMQVQDIANKLRPNWLGRTYRPDDGAPIISPDGVVESGNGRTIALQQVYEQGGAKAEEYRRFVEGQGFDTSGMEQPVMVRVRDEPMTTEQARGFAREANMATALGMAPTEQALADADALPAPVMSLYQGGDVDLVQNREFVRRMLAEVSSDTERARLLGSNGEPNKTAFVRVRNAMIARAFGNPRLVENIAEATDSKIVAIGGALTDVAGAWSQMLAEVEAGQVKADYDITENLNEALELVERARREGVKVADLVNQSDMFSGDTINPTTEGVLRWFFARPDFTKPTGRARLVTALNTYIETARADRADQGGLLDDNASADVAGATRAGRVQQGYGQEGDPATEAAAAGINDGPGGDRAGSQPDGRDSERSAGEGVPAQRGQEDSGQAELAPAPAAEPAPSTTRQNIDRLAERATAREATTSEPAPRATDAANQEGGDTSTEATAKTVAGKGVLGQNDKGDDVFEDENGVRSTVESIDGVRIRLTESVGIIPGRGISVDLSRRDDRFKTASELGEERAQRETSARDGYRQLLKKAGPAQIELADKASAMPGWSDPGIKSIDRVVEKVVTENYGSVSDLKDIVRGGFFVDTMQDAMRVADWIRETFPVVQDKGWVQIPRTGYTDHKIIVTVNGVNAELQIVPSPIWKAKKAEAGKLYTANRALPFNDPKRMAAEAKQREIYAAAVSDGDFSILSTADKSASGNIDEKALRESVAPSLPTSPGAERQAPSRQTDAVASENSTTGRSSTSRNSADNRSMPANVGANDAQSNNANATDEVARPSEAEMSRKSWQDDFDAAGKRLRGRLDAVKPESLRDMLTAMDERGMTLPDGDAIEMTNPHRAVELGYIELTVAEDGYRRMAITDKGRAFVNGDAPSAPAPNANRFAKNTLFTEDKVAAARARMAERMKRLNSGVDPEMLIDGMVIAGAYIESGVRNFAEFSKQMRDDFGNNITPYLLSFWEGSRNYPGLDTSGMTPPDASRAMHDMMLADLPAAENRDTPAPDGVQDTLSDGDARAGAAAVPPAETQRGARIASATEVDGGARPVRPADASGAEATERSGAGSSRTEPGRADRAQSADRVPPSVKGKNWRIEPGSLEESRKPAQKLRDNLAAVELVKALDAEGRLPTRDEQALIARYVGWGGLKNAFPGADGSYGKGFETAGPRLRVLLTDAEYDTARRSIQYAHYTSEKVVRPMWQLAEQLGFTGGLVFEPGMGTGNFLGMMPQGLAASSKYQGVEFDGLTERIAHYLYPESGIRQDDYTRSPAVKDAFDLVIGNPPFSGTVVKSDPEYGKLGFVLHDFFFAKAMESVKPGGLLMFVTSAGTMNKSGAKAREYLADRADLLGAVRLPSTAFAENAGTAVTTDIVVLRKRMEGETPGDRSWTETRAVDLQDKSGATVQGNVNAYFLDNPDMVLGEQGMFDQLAAGPRYAVRARPGVDMEAAIAEAMGKIKAVQVTSSPAASEAVPMAVDFNVNERKEGSFYLSDDGKLMQLVGGAGREVQAPGKGVKGGISKANQQKVRKLIPVRDALRETIARDLAGDSAGADKARAALNKSYDAFVKEFGPINQVERQYRAPSIVQQESARAAAREEARDAGTGWDEGTFDATPMLDAGAGVSEIARARRDAREAAKAAGRPFNEGSFDPSEMDDIVIEKRPNVDAFMGDQEGYRLRSIEHFNDDTGEAKKGLVFYEAPMARETKPAISSVQDALFYVLNKRGRPVIDDIAREAGVTREEALDSLGDAVFRVPGGDAFETRELYLSGNVREKLEIARRAAEDETDLRRNVAALEAAQPTPLGKTDIHASLGMPWMPVDVVNQFATEALGLRTFAADYNTKLAAWSISNTSDTRSVEARSTWGTERREAPYIIGDALNRNTPKIYETNSDKTRTLNEPETQAVQDKLAAIREKFSEWIWSDDTRADRLIELYNREFNSMVAPNFDGAYLETPGLNANWKLRPHQSAVVARIVQTGNTYMAHGVGAGKTSAMISSGMEMKRLGLVNKPTYVVPNHMLGQFTKEFYEQYPSANIMVADDKRFHTDRRKQFVADLANNDLDAVIITHSAFGLLPPSEQWVDKLITEEVDDYRSLLSEMDKSDPDLRITRSRMEKQIEGLEQRLSVNKRSKKDQVYTFEETGIDFLFVDEAHLFRKLSFSTKMGNIKGVDPKGAMSSFDLDAKIRYLETKRPGRTTVLASGTPITNTMAELFTVQRFLQRGELVKRNIDQFDAWAGAFGDTDTKLEQDPAGGYKPVTRFAKFVNVPELSVMVRQFMDVVTSEELGQLVVRPALKGGKRNMVVVEQTDAQSDYQETLKRRMEAIEKRTGPPKPGDDILLSVINDGRKSAIDMRVVDRDAPREDSKLEQLIGNVARIWKETKRQPFHAIEKDGYSAEPVDFGPATQMIFSDLGVNETEGGMSVHQYMRRQLIQKGIPAREIALISDFKNMIQKQRLFNDMNEGKVRVLIGSVPKMGTGVNAQKRLYANHNLDAQWYPANDEQRNGRIIRQGNMNPEIELYDYSTKGTYDSTMWGLMETKARFIEGFMRGDPTMRDMEDLGEASQYEQAKALTTSDPRIQTLTEYRQSLDKALRRRDAFERGVAQVRRRVADAKAEVATYTERAALIEQDIAQRVDVKGDAFRGTIGDVTFEKRAAFGEAMMKAADKIAARKTVSGKAVELGRMGGFPIVGEARMIGGEVVVDMSIARAGDRLTQIKETNSAAGLVQSITARLDSFEDGLEFARARIASGEQIVQDFANQTEQTFEGGAEIDALKKQVSDLESVLLGESKKGQAVADEKLSIVDDDLFSAPQPERSMTERQRAELAARQQQGMARRGGQQGLGDQDGGLFGAERDQGSLFMRGLDEGSAADLTKRMKALGIADKVTTRVADLMKRGDSRIRGTFSMSADGQPLIQLARAGDVDALNHEVIHAIKALGLFRDAEWSTLSRAAANDRAMMADIERRYPDLDRDAQIEEAVADRYKAWAAGQRERGFVQKAFDRIKAFLEALGEVVGIARPSDAQSVMRGVESGRIGAREAADGDPSFFGLVPRDMVGKQTETEAFRRWFGASQVIEPRTGEPLSVFHRTDAEFTVFDTVDFGSWFAEKQSTADNYGDRGEGEPRTIEAFLKIERPLVIPESVDLSEMISVADSLEAINAENGTDFTASDLGNSWPADYEGNAFEWIGMDPAMVEAAKVAGFDGLLAYEEGERTWNVFRPEQVKSATDNLGQFDGANPDIRFSIVDRARTAMVDAVAKTDPLSDRGFSLFDRWRTGVQDRFLPLLRVQQAVEQQLGRPLSAQENPYVGEELMTGRIGSRLEKLTEDYVEPMMAMMHQLKVGVDELETFLYARHAPERNAQIAKINPQFTPGEGSGMTDIQAAAIMKRAEREGRLENLEKVADYVDAMRDWALDRRIESGLISKEEADLWRATYQNYVPLRGKKEVEGESADRIAERINRGGSGINVRGKESRRAFGRRSEADDILAYTILQAEEAIVRSETNRVAQRFVDLAGKAPDPDFWTVNKVTRKPVFDASTGLVRYENQTRLQAEDKDWTVIAKVDGNEVRVTMNRDNASARRLADSMRNLTQQQLAWVTQYAGKLNRFLSTVNTSYNPEFVITNAFRDIQTAVVNLAAVDTDKMISGTLRDYPKAMKASVQGAFRKGSGEWKRWHDEFTSEGGRVYFNQVEDVDGLKKRIEKSFAQASGKLTVKRGLLAVRDVIDNVNTGVENAVRLSAYKNAREGGLSKEQAASLAKNLTVNFNRRGQFGPAINSFYLFFNASVQGSVRILQAMKSKRVRKILAGVAVTGFALELLNAFASGEDDDGESFYDKIGDYDKSRNLIVMMPGSENGEHIKIPLPYGYNVFFGAGRGMAEIARRGGDRWEQSLSDMLTTVVDSFNPIGGTESLLNFVAPTIADPIVDLERNRDYADRPIMPEQNQFGVPVPDAQRFFASVGPQWKAITDFLSGISGGDDVKEGAIDVSPETLEYLFGYATGAAGSFVDRNVGLGAKLLDPEAEVEANDLPMARKVIGTKPGWYDKSAYYDRTAQVEKAISNAKDYIELQQGEELQRYVADNEKLLMLEAPMKAAQKDMRVIRKAKVANELALRLGQIDDAAAMSERKVFKDAETLVVDRFNTQWNQTMYPK